MKFQPGQIVSLAVLQSERKKERLLREAERKQEEEWNNVGEWTPEDELPDPDERVCSKLGRSNKDL